MFKAKLKDSFESGYVRTYYDYDYRLFGEERPDTRYATHFDGKRGDRDASLQGRKPTYSKQDLSFEAYARDPANLANPARRRYIRLNYQELEIRRLTNGNMSNSHSI